MMPARTESGNEKTKSEPIAGIVVARNGHNLTESGETRTKIQPRQLVVFKDGKLVYASKLDRYPNYDPALPYSGGWAYVDGERLPMYEDHTT